ncbi:transcriptional activator DEMETER-like isoform X1 [Prunus yedoensis var. nudiflora]|uniref:Transcriptional activator DEMETER-like isoform X1 n=1 Tax=Prunus yedoensis var. nudiflora TaxID=2094558 RepID=A0A314ZQ10_PRUYE|nr:transcriptional activator DEMETER-like isoform X1 [Prunus yedoensis var. nudiflora]
MGKEGSGGIEGNHKEKEKYWEEERKVFQGRVESFIARMHLVQGDRRFSKWKGSVVDSVIGVFLTQNVSDHLSSSAFMSLAARFPPKSSNHQAHDKVVTNILVEEPEVQMKSPDDSTKWHEEISSQPIYNQMSMALNESAEIQRDSETIGMERNLVEAHSQCLEEEFVSSQDSFESSVTQGAVGIRSYSVSNSEAEDPITGCRSNKIHMSISTNQQMEKVTKFQDLYHQVQVPVAPSKSNQLHMYPHFGELEPWRFANFSEEIISSWPSTASRFNVKKDEKNKSRNEELSGSVVNSSVQQNILWTSQETPTVDPYASFRQQSTDQQNNSQPRSSNGCNQPSYYSHQCEGNQNFQLEKTSVREPVKPLNHFRERRVVACSMSQNVNELKKNSCSVVDSISVVNKQVHMENQSVDSNLQEQLYSYGQSHNEANTNISKGRKGRAGSDKKNAVDWDMLRKQAQANGRKKERNKETMDSLDYEALINANVKDISDAIKERGMNNMLAERIQEFLNRLVREHGSIDLEWLRDVPPDKAKDYLLSIRGLGLKSVECVRLLTLHHLAFPVDTNVGRIAVRLGWVPLQPLPESLQLHLLEMYPMLESIQKYLWPRLCKLDQLTLYELHYQMITFGKVFCTKSKPNCNACPMRGECRHFASAFASARLALPGPEEKSIVSSSVSVEVR